jgi:hypothetical protein
MNSGAAPMQVAGRSAGFAQGRVELKPDESDEGWVLLRMEEKRACDTAQVEQNQGWEWP